MARLHTLLKFVFIVLAALLGAVGARAQEYRVESFEIVPKDLSARTEGLVDANGRKCAVVKVYVKDAITDIDGPVVGEVRDRGMEKWVYVMHDAKRLRLLFKEHMPLDLTFADYDYPTLTGQMTYVLKLAESTPVANNVTPAPQPQPAPQLHVAQIPTQEPTLTPAQMCEKGNDAYHSHNYAEALSWYRKAADQGNVRAQYNLGVMYDHGDGVEQDYAEAVNWFRKAADQGHARAQFNLGNMYSDGTGVDQDDAEAVRWYRKAADQGLAYAQFNLGYMYSNGHGVDQDYAEAVTWYRKAADQGDTDAQYWLGVMYDNGRGGNQDYAEAVSWYRKAADQGNARAQCNLGSMYYDGTGVGKDVSKAKELWEKAAAQGNSTAKSNLERYF